MAMSLGAMAARGGALGQAETRGQIYKGRTQIEEFLQALQDKIQGRMTGLGQGKFLSKFANFIIPMALMATGNPALAATARKVTPFATAGLRRFAYGDIEKKLDIPEFTGMFGGSRNLLAGVKQAQDAATNIRQQSQVGTITDLVSGYFAGKAGSSAGEYLGTAPVEVATAGKETAAELAALESYAGLGPAASKDIKSLMSWLSVEPQFSNLYSRGRPRTTAQYGGGYTNV